MFWGTGNRPCFAVFRACRENTGSRATNPDRAGRSLSGEVHDTEAVQVWKIAECVKVSGVIGSGGKGCVDLFGVVFRPFKGRDKSWWKKQADFEHAEPISPGARAFLRLGGILCRPRGCPKQVGEIARSALVLQLREAGRKRITVISRPCFSKRP